MPRQRVNPGGVMFDRHHADHIGFLPSVCNHSHSSLLNNTLYNRSQSFLLTPVYILGYAPNSALS